MNVGVLGTGIAGRTIASRLVELGHSVVMGTRDPAATLARTEPDWMGNPPLKDWLKQNSAINLRSFAEAAAHGDMVVNATNGSGSLEALKAAGESNLNDKVLIDLSNPLDDSKGMPPPLFVSNIDSLGEQIQRAFPGSKMVKTLNMVTARIMVYPRQLGDGKHTVFLSGDDPEAKARVSELLGSFGWEDITDLGDMTTARGAEMYLPLWLRMWGALGTVIMNVRVVR